MPRSGCSSRMPATSGQQSAPTADSRPSPPDRGWRRSAPRRPRRRPASGTPTAGSRQPATESQRRAPLISAPMTSVGDRGDEGDQQHHASAPAHPLRRQQRDDQHDDDGDRHVDHLPAGEIERLEADPLGHRRRRGHGQHDAQTPISSTATSVQRSTVHHQRPSRLVSVRAKERLIAQSPGPARGRRRRAPRSSGTGRRRRRPATAAPPAVPPSASRRRPRRRRPPRSSVPQRADRRPCPRASRAKASAASPIRKAWRTPVQPRQGRRQPALLRPAAGDPVDAIVAGQRPGGGVGVGRLPVVDVGHAVDDGDPLLAVRQAGEIEDGPARSSSPATPSARGRGIGRRGVLPVVLAGQRPRLGAGRAPPSAGPRSRRTAAVARRRRRPDAASAGDRPAIGGCRRLAPARCRSPGCARRRRRRPPSPRPRTREDARAWRRCSRPCRRAGRDGRA